MLDRQHEYAKMAAVEDRLWWYRALHRLVLDSIAPAFPDRRARVLDAGCGTGGLVAYLRARGFADVHGFDLSPDAVAWCRERGLEVRQSSLLDITREHAPRSFDVIVSNDTLYFLDAAQQQHVVAQVAATLRPGGLWIANLPALRAFAGIHDKSVGIDERFSRRDLPRIVPTKWFELRRATYWPFLLSPVIWATRALQRRRMRRDPDFEVRSDVELPSPLVNAALHALTRAENALSRWKPFGSSLFVVGRRRADDGAGVSPPVR